MPDVFALLEQDHRTVKSLFDQFAQSGDPETALAICEELTIHALLEEELVYPVLATKVQGQMAQEARREHDEAKSIISQIESGIGRGEDVSALVQQLQQDVRHHVQEEEQEVFPKLAQAAGTEALGELGQRVAQSRAFSPRQDQPTL